MFFALSTCLEQNHYIYNHETPIESGYGCFANAFNVNIKGAKGPFFNFQSLPPDAILNVICVHTCKCQHAQLIVYLQLPMCHACRHIITHILVYIRYSYR
jgi:hypothetical protein